MESLFCILLRNTPKEPVCKVWRSRDQTTSGEWLPPRELSQELMVASSLVARSVRESWELSWLKNSDITRKNKPVQVRRRTRRRRRRIRRRASEIYSNNQSYLEVWSYKLSMIIQEKLQLPSLYLVEVINAVEWFSERLTIWVNHVFACALWVRAQFMATLILGSPQNTWDDLRCELMCT